MSTGVWVGVVVLGGVGATARFLLDARLGERAGRGFPFGTFTVNATGALLLGLLTGLAAGDDVLVLAGAATLGSYTTFSTWMLESQRLAEDSQLLEGVVNLLLSLAVGLGAAALGRTIGAGL